MSVAGGILFGPAGSAIRSTGDLLSFFDSLRQLSAIRTTGSPTSNSGISVAELLRWREVPVPALPTLSQCDLGLFADAVRAFRVYVPWIPFEARRRRTPSGRSAVSPRSMPMRCRRWISAATSATPARARQLTSITSPQTYETNGCCRPARRCCRVQFPGRPASTYERGACRYHNDPNLDPRTFTLGDIKVGDITIKMPEGQHFFSTDIDFTATRGSSCIAAGIDLFQTPASATWLIEAIDPPDRSGAEGRNTPGC